MIKKIFIILQILTPILVFIQPYFFIFSIFLSILVLGKLTNYNFFTLFYYLFIYFGFTFLGFKLYDLMIFITFLFFILNKKTILINQFIVVFFYFIIFIFIQFLLVSPQLFGFVEILRFSISLILVVLIFSNPYELDISSFKLIYLGFFLQFLVVAILFNILPLSNVIIKNSFMELITFNYPDIQRYSGFFSDPNKMALFSIFTFLTILKLENGVFKFFSIYNLILIMTILLSGSRTFFLSLFLFYFLLVLPKSFFRLKIHYLFPIIFIVFFLVFDISNIFLYINNFLVFFGRDSGSLDASLFTDNRYLIYQKAIEFILKNPIFGYGALSINNYLPYPTHNTFLNFQFDFGLMGLFFAIYLNFLSFKRLKSIYYLPFILLPMLLLDLGNFRLFYILIFGVFSKRGGYELNFNY